MSSVKTEAQEICDLALSIKLLVIDAEKVFDQGEDGGKWFILYVRSPSGFSTLAIGTAPLVRGLPIDLVEAIHMDDSTNEIDGYAFYMSALAKGKEFVLAQRAANE